MGRFDNWEKGITVAAKKIIDQLQAENKALAQRACVCNGAIAKDEGGVAYCRISVKLSNLQAENQKWRDEELQLLRKIEQLIIGERRHKKALQCWIDSNEGAPNKTEWARKALESEVKDG